jgi:hypothetical protein
MTCATILKAPLIPNIILGMCNVWVILERNDIYISIVKNLILINFFTAKVADYVVIT